MQRQLKNLLAIIGGLIFTTSLLLVLLNRWMIATSCGNTVYQVIDSPDATYKVVLFNRNCGVGSGPNTQVSILAAGKELTNDSGNTFIWDGAYEGKRLNVSWIDDTQLRIEFDDRYDVLYQRQQVSGVIISYHKNK